MAKYLISIIRPKNYMHSSAFQEVAETLHYGLLKLGHESALLENAIDRQRKNILLGAHLLSDRELNALPDETIIYNLEQLNAADLRPAYRRLSERCSIWDYSPLNLAQWQQQPRAFQPALVEIGYAPILKRIAPAPMQDIDVLFYGSESPSRRAILERLQHAGVNVQWVYAAYGQMRDNLIARAKIVLNLHYYESKLFEIVRVSYLLANAKAVVSETAPDIGDYAQAVAAFSPEEIVEGCMALLNDEQQRKQLESRGHEFFRRKPIEEILEKVLTA